VLLILSVQIQQDLPPGPPIRPSDLIGSNQIRSESIGIYQIRLYLIRCCLETETRNRIGARWISTPIGFFNTIAEGLKFKKKPYTKIVSISFCICSFRQSKKNFVSVCSFNNVFQCKTVLFSRYIIETIFL
jgi:hypothetical protein